VRRGWLVVLLLALAGLAGPAQAQNVGGQFFAFGIGGGKVLSETNVPLQTTGELVVSFRGDAAAGCAAAGLCAYSGTIIVRPTGGNLSIATVQRGKRIEHAATLLLVTPESGPVTSARVQRSGPGGQGGTCADGQGFPLFGNTGSAVARGGALTIRVLAPGGTLLQTRCAGPLDGDLASASPAVTVPLATALRGRTSLDLSGTRAFAVHGFAGTITSTLVLNLGMASQQSTSSSSIFPPGVKTQRLRIVTERLSLVRVQGGLSAAASGTADPIVCRLLDTCGLTGTLTLAPAAPDFNADVIAQGPASRPYRDFLTAVGLARSGRPQGISVGVSVDLFGHVGAEMSQAGVTCTDTGGPGVVFAAIGISSPVQSAGGFTGGWRTRCPGPQFGASQVGVVASLRPGALEHQQFTIDMRGSGSFTDDGYVVLARGDVSALLRRGRITSQVITQPSS
jgi:hypothetical protein